jgi:RNase P/RNase MRP subunit p29
MPVSMLYSVEENTMKSLIAMTLLTVSLHSFAAAPKTYQVTGPVLEMTDTTIVVQKGKEKWEIAKDAAAKISGELKVGSKVTIEYFMTAKSVEVKEDKKAAKK